MFKIGDKVKIISNSCGRSYCSNCGFQNKIGTITAFKDGFYTVKNFTKMGDRYCSGFVLEMLERIDNKKICNKYGITKFLEGLNK